MFKIRRAALAVALCFAGVATSAGAQSFSDADLAVAAKLREVGQSSNLAYDLVDSLVTEVGARPAGSANDKKAVDWAVSKLKSLGFPVVRAEAVPLKAWKRGEAHAHITEPFAQPLVMTALGGSVAAPKEGIKAEVAYYPDFAALKADTSDKARGRIVFVDQKTERFKDGRGYGPSSAARTAGPTEAGKRGALAFAIRSVGTDHDRLAHTGATRYTEGVPAIPAFAVSVPDADTIARLQRYGKPVKMHLAMQNELGIDAVSHNVIAEIPGTDLADEIITIGGHLDSWDLGQGAIDDGAGVAITAAAAKLILDSGAKPRRTIRVVMFANEENGLDGGRAYSEKYKDQKHQLVAESDFGAGNIYRFQTRVRPEALGVAMVIAEQLKPLGVEAGNNEARTGADTGTIQRVANLPILSFSQDGTDYFDYHHTANDTLDKIDPAKLRQNVAVWATAVWLSAQSPVAFHPLPPVEKKPAQ